MVKGGEAGLYFLALTPGFTSPFSLCGGFTHQEKPVPWHLGCRVHGGRKKLQNRGADSMDVNPSNHRGLTVGFALSLQIFG